MKLPLHKHPEDPAYADISVFELVNFIASGYIKAYRFGMHLYLDLYIRELRDKTYYELKVWL